MENEQETSQPKPLTKSFRRRQRRKEAAALQKQALASKVVFNEVESTIQIQDKQSEVKKKIINEDTAPVRNSKSKSELSEPAFSCQDINAKRVKNSSKTYADKDDSSLPSKGEIFSAEKTSTLSRSKRRRNRKKALLPAIVGDAQGENIDIEEGQPCADVPKSAVQFTLHHICSWEDYISGKDRLIPSTVFTCNDNDNLVYTGRNYFEKANVLEKIVDNNHSSSSENRKSVFSEEEIDKLEKDTIISEELDIIANEKSELKCVCGTLDSDKKKQENEASVTSLLDFKEGFKSDFDLENPQSKIENSKDLPKILSNSEIDSGEEQNQSSFVFQQSGIDCSDSPKSHSVVNFENHPTAVENIEKAVIVASIESEMNKGKGKNDKQISRKESPPNDEEMVKSNSDKKDTVKVMDNVEQKATSKTCEKGGKDIIIAKGEEKSRDKVKAEREARKAAKMVKKQKEKAPPDMKTMSEAADSHSSIKGEVEEEQIDKKNGVFAVKSELLEKLIQNSESNGSTKSKAELRAERRAKQEAQRAAKVAATSDTSSNPLQIKVKTAEFVKVPKLPMHESKKIELKDALIKSKPVRREQGAKLLSRLGWEDGRVKRESEGTLRETHLIHPAIVRLGTRFTDRIISGSNARCIAFVQAIKKAIQDYQTPPHKELGRDLEARLLALSLAYLEAQRPHAVSVSNATRFLKWQLTQLQRLQQCSSDSTIVPSPESKRVTVMSDEEAKHNLIEGLDAYIWEKIEVAERAVCDTLRDKIKDGDVILTYGCSYLLQQILIGAKKTGTKFKVVVVDGRPWREGREMLRCLVGVGIPCSYVLLSAASSVMRQVNKVLLGAHALLSNGYVMSRVGVSQVALLASAHNVPVLVACETHKFCERVQSDSFVYNEMGEPDGLAQLLGGEDGPLSEWRTLPCLSLLNLSYDVTPPELVTAVATELAVLPCTSVPVVLRVRPTEPVATRHLGSQ